MSFSNLDWEGKLSNYTKIKTSLQTDTKNKLIGLNIDGINFDILCSEISWEDLPNDIDKSIKKELMFTKKDEKNLEKTVVENFILLVPVSPKSINNYNFEKEYFNRGDKYNAIWTGTSKKTEKIGNRFGFCNNKTDIIEIFIIIDIKNYSKNIACKSWDENSFKNKNIVFLSKKIAEISFSHYKKYMKYNDNFMIQGAQIYPWDDILLKKILNPIHTFFHRFNKLFAL